MLLGAACTNPFDLPPSANDTFRTRDLTFRLETVVDEVRIPWGMDWLPDGSMLITTLRGPLYHFDKQGTLTEIQGVPEVKARGQGGLLDVQLHPNYTENGWIYLSYSKPHPEKGDSEATTAVVRARLQEDRLVDREIIFEALPYSTTRRHYGSRLEFDREGYLFLTVGDRGNRDENPQSLGNHCGKIHRLNDDGSIPPDNPFVDQEGAVASIWSYGHRNPQGLALHPETGVLWAHEHGPRGGDEVNIIRKGHNYGWPVISYGINYSGTRFTDKTEAPGMDQPVLYWDPSIAPCGMDFVSGDRYPAWKGDLLVGSLKFEYLKRCIMDGDEVVGQENLLEDIGRLRQVKMGPDGYIYLAVEDADAIFRIVPVEDQVR